MHLPHKMTLSDFLYWMVNFCLSYCSGRRHLGKNVEEELNHGSRIQRLPTSRVSYHVPRLLPGVFFSWFGWSWNRGCDRELLLGAIRWRDLAIKKWTNQARYGRHVEPLERLDGTSKIVSATASSSSYTPCGSVITYFLEISLLYMRVPFPGDIPGGKASGQEGLPPQGFPPPFPGIPNRTKL
jgi:hypothetical protein